MGHTSYRRQYRSLHASVSPHVAVKSTSNGLLEFASSARFSKISLLALRKWSFAIDDE